MSYINQVKQRLVLILFVLLVPLVFVGLMVAPLNGPTVAKEIEGVSPVALLPFKGVSGSHIKEESESLTTSLSLHDNTRPANMPFSTTINTPIDLDLTLIMNNFAYRTALTDIDGNGLLDLATATSSNFSAPYSVILYYSYENGVVSRPLFDSSDAINFIAWADVNNDSDPDLAIATNGVDQLYQNINGTLQLMWQSTLVTHTYALAWGDINGDKWIDLVTGGLHHWQVYLNDNGNLPLTASYTYTYPASSLDLGDWDNDGDLDLAVAYNGGLSLLLMKVLNFRLPLSGM